MAFSQGVDFRSTGPYVADAAGNYAQITPGSGGNYPTLTPQGNNVGWEGTAFGQIDSRDRSTTVDKRLAGTNFTTTAAAAKYRIDLPGPGTYNIRIAAGDASFNSTGVYVELFDDTTSLGVLANGAPTAGNFMDATGATLSAANWPANNTMVTKTFTSSICRFAIGSTAGTSRVISHVYVEAVAAGGSGTTRAHKRGRRGKR